jgi:hypothetical protein
MEGHVGSGPAHFPSRALTPFTLRQPVQSRPIGATLKIRFTKEEDEQLQRLIEQHGTSDWNLISSLHGTRNRRQCRERYANYLAPSLRDDPWSPEEDALLLSKYAELGSQWNRIGFVFHNRSCNALRNRWQLLNRRDLSGQRKAAKAALKATAELRGRTTPMPGAQAQKRSDGLPSAVQEKRPDDLALSLFDFDQGLEARGLSAQDANEFWVDPLCFYR